MAAGARLHRLNSPATLSEAAGSPRLHLKATTLQTELLIFADAVLSPGLCPFLQTSLFRARVQHVAARSARPLNAAGTAASGFEHFRPLPGPSILLGGFRYLTLDLGFEFKDDRPDPRIQARQRQVLSDWSPQHTVTHEWVTWLELSCDNLPLVGAVPGNPRQHLLVGFGSADETVGVACALALAHRILENPTPPLLPDLLNPRRIL
jgi:glycine/D-amino acid oxidase-like deaminating enzyme